MDSHVALCKLVMDKGYPNAWGAKIPVKLNWNLQLLNSLLAKYEDREVVMWLTYGWPISRPPNIADPIPTFKNHSSALNYPQFIEECIKKERNRGAICGPFQEIPFSSRVGVSPLSTREKRETTDHRVLMDLSWPEGQSVNSGISKDQFMGFSAKLTFPTIDAIAKRVAELNGKAWLFKVDLASYFRQLPLDPGDYSLMCFTWQNSIYFDVVSPQGLQSAPYFAQHTSNAIKYIHNQANYFLFNYIDNFIGIETVDKIQSSCNSFVRLLTNLGVKESESKRVELTRKLNCVGTLVDAEKNRLEVLPERQTSLMEELEEWQNKESCSLHDIQHLVGKLQFICSVVRPGRLFMSRMLELLRSLGREDRIKVSEEFKLDVAWWIKFLPEFNGVGIMWMWHIKQPDKILASDACLLGMGAVCGTEYIKAQFPCEWIGVNIAYLELLAVVVMCKTWKEKLSGKSIVIKCDNESVCTVLNSGRSRDKILLRLMREMVFVAATEKFEYKTVHVCSKANLLPDLLSRWHQGERVRRKFHEMVKGKGYKEITVACNGFDITHEW